MRPGSFVHRSDHTGNIIGPDDVMQIIGPVHGRYVQCVYVMSGVDVSHPTDSLAVVPARIVPDNAPHAWPEGFFSSSESDYRIEHQVDRDPEASYPHIVTVVKDGFEIACRDGVTFADALLHCAVDLQRADLAERPAHPGVPARFRPQPAENGLDDFHSFA
jgi:hypothetical protein